MHCLGFLSGNFLEQAQFNAVIPHIKKRTGLNLKPEQQQLLQQPEPQAQKEDKVKEKDPILTCEEDELCKVNGEEVCTVPAELECPPGFSESTREGHEGECERILHRERASITDNMVISHLQYLFISFCSQPISNQS
jgi:hypothetical protein